MKDPRRNLPNRPDEQTDSASGLIVRLATPWQVFRWLLKEREQSGVQSSQHRGVARLFHNAVRDISEADLPALSKLRYVIKEIHSERLSIVGYDELNEIKVERFLEKFSDEVGFYKETDRGFIFRNKELRVKFENNQILLSSTGRFAGLVADKSPGARDERHSVGSHHEGELVEQKLGLSFLDAVRKMTEPQLNVLAASMKVILGSGAPNPSPSISPEELNAHLNTLMRLSLESADLKRAFVENAALRSLMTETDPVAVEIALTVTETWERRKLDHPGKPWIKNPSKFVAHVYREWFEAGTLKQVHLKHDPSLYQRYAEHISVRPNDDLGLAKSPAGRPSTRTPS